MFICSNLTSTYVIRC